MVDFVSPSVSKEAFHCPHCGSYSDQFWIDFVVNTGSTSMVYTDFKIGCCRRCENLTIWKTSKMIYPLTGNAPLPNPDMPPEIQTDYLEARDIISRSPRSACVLLRLCIEKICTKLEPSGDLNEKIKKLVERGLDSQIQRALDSIRVIGGQAVHPLEMDLKDDVATAQKLFKIANYIADWAFTRQKTIDEIFEKLPDGKKKAIEKRDGVI